MIPIEHVFGVSHVNTLTFVVRYNDNTDYTVTHDEYQTTCPMIRLSFYFLILEDEEFVMVT